MTDPISQKEKNIRVAALLFMLAISATGLRYSWQQTTASDTPVETPADCEGGCHTSAPEESPVVKRQAERLMRRLGQSIGVDKQASLEKALADRQELLTRSVTVRATDKSGSGAHVDTWSFTLSKHPELVALKDHWIGDRFEIDQTAFAEILTTTNIPGMNKYADAHISSINSDGYVLRANADQIARTGFVYDAEELADEISDALYANTSSVEMKLPYKQGVVYVDTESGTQVLTLLATGISDYSDSPDERVWNVHKAIDERVNNVVVNKGDEFSFVATLGGPVTLAKGWKEGMGLFGGGAALTPGAGICQAATTVFRAALLAGMPITERRNHSMFVDHYEPYGVGLDATIFPGVHDMTFRNDTAGPLVMQAYTSGDDVFVHMYGIADGRTVALDGPYFASTRPRADELRALGQEEIGWVRHVTYADGKVLTKPLIAWYHKGFMRSVVNKYAGTPGIVLLEAKVEVGEI